MNKDHPLAKCKSLDMADLKKEKFVFIDRKEVPLGYDKFVNNCVKSGFSPNIIKHCSSFESLSLLIKLGIGITILPKFNVSGLGDNLVFVPLKDEITVNNVLIWNENNLNATVNLFLKYLNSLQI